MSVHAYLMHRRAEKAVHSLLSSDVSVTRIAFDSGYSTPSHLAAALRAALQTSPSVLRQKASLATF